MALIVLQHSVVDNFDVDPEMTVSSSTRILQGAIVGLNTSGFLSRPSTSVQPLGIAGDNISDEYETTAYSAELVVGRASKLADGSYVATKRFTAPRVSDYFNEAAASGKMTVYFGNGKFATDQYAGGDSFTPGAKLYAAATGVFTTTAGASALSTSVGRVIKAPTDYPSGVPGVDSPAVENSISLGQYLIVHLNIA